MPTTNPRVNVTLTPAVDAVVTRFAAMQRVSKSQVLRELLEVVHPSLERAVVLMEAAKGASQEAMTRIAQDMRASVVEAEKAAAVVNVVVQSHVDDLVAQAESVRGKRPRRAAAAVPRRSTRAQGASVGARKRSDPPSSKRGVKSEKRGADQ